jgi:hypothetical protein
MKQEISFVVTFKSVCPEEAPVWTDASRPNANESVLFDAIEMCNYGWMKEQDFTVEQIHFDEQPPRETPRKKW